MALPVFNDKGILPEGIHNCSLNEAEQLLVSDGRRKELWEKLGNFLNWIKPMNFFEFIYIDGSFLTDKPTPNDIDLVLEIKQNTTSGLSNVDPKVFNNPYVKSQFSLDVYVTPYIVPTNYNDFREFFQYIGIKEGLNRGLNPKEKKGILKVML